MPRTPAPAVDPIPQGRRLTRYMTTCSQAAAHRAASMSLLGLDALPCGCVTGIYCARPTAVEVEFVEAKGPHCVFPLHRADQVTRLGLPEMLAEPAEASV
jgi:hypothetical protein